MLAKNQRIYSQFKIFYIFLSNIFSLCRTRPDLPILLENEVIVKIAKKYNKTPAQVCLRWGIQRNIVMLPKSVTPSRILQNAQVNYNDSKFFLLFQFFFMKKKGI